MAPQEAKPQGSREAGPATRGRGGRPVARGLGRAGWGAARCTGVRGPGAGASHDAPPRPPTLLLGLLLLAALLEHGQADPGKRSAAGRPRRFLEERGGGTGPIPAQVAVERYWQHRLWDSLRPLLLQQQANCQKSVFREGTLGGEEKKKCNRLFFLDKL